MVDYASESWRIRVEASRDAQRRSRYVFAVWTVASVAFLISIWNSVFSWAENHAAGIIKAEQAEKRTPPQVIAPPRLPSGQLGEFQRSLIDQRLRDWVSSERIDIPLLGVSISGADVPVLGALSLLVISLWFYFCSRRENELIAEMLDDADRDSSDNGSSLRRMVFHAIESHLVFTSLSEMEDARYTLRPVPPKPWKVGRAVIHRLVTILFFLPFLTMVFSMAGDLWTLSKPPMFRFFDMNMALATALTSSDWRHLAVSYAPTLVVTTILWYMCREIWDLHCGTRSILVEFRDKHIAPMIVATSNGGSVQHKVSECACD